MPSAELLCVCDPELRSFSFLSACAKGALSLSHPFSLSLSCLALWQRESSSVFVSSAVLLLLVHHLGNFNKRNKTNLMNLQVFPQFFFFVNILFLLKTQRTHTHTQNSHIHTHSSYTRHTINMNHILGPLYVIIICCHIASRHNRAFILHSCQHYLLIRPSFRALLPTNLSRSFSLFFSVPPYSARANVYYVHNFSWYIYIFFIKFFLNNIIL